MEKSGQRTVPQIWVGSTHVGGYSDLQVLETSGDLDELLSINLEQT
jgi:glutaredoxin 3